MIGPHSTWEGEAKAQRAKAEELAQRVQELEAVLCRASSILRTVAPTPVTRELMMLVVAIDASLKQEGE